MSKKTNDFNSVAGMYDSIANVVFKKSLMESQLNFLDELPQEGHILFIGGGSGKILPDLWKLRPKLHIDFLDASQKMINKAEKRLRRKPNAKIRFISGTENDIEPDATYDAILTFFFLDLFPTEKKLKVAKKLNTHLKKGGIWLHADFNEAHTFMQRMREKSMFLFFKMVSNIEADKITDDSLVFDQLNLHLQRKKINPKAGVYSAIYKIETLD
tara:strand:- start:334 stop:975 length:642 start_codon:yes stop_codon:yes gene_type:complete